MLTICAITVISRRIVRRAAGKHSAASFPAIRDARERLVHKTFQRENIFRKKIIMRFKETEYSRKLDTCGRLVIPSKLREAMRLEVGENYPFFTTVDEEGQSWLCIPCPGAETEIDKAKRLLREAGITSLD